MTETSDRFQTLAERIATREAAVAVIGLGYVGLPLAVAIANAGYRTIGIDQDGAKIRQLNAGGSYIADVPSGQLRRPLSSGRLTFSTSYSEASAAQVAVIAVPTPIDEYRSPDLSHVAAAARGVAAVLRPPSLVILESTTYPGATEETLGTAFRERGFTLGRDVFVGYSPERIDPGNPTYRLTNTPKLVAGLSAESLELAVTFYAAFVDTMVPVSSIRTAEAVKLFENTFRMVNIALVNEFQLICEAFGIDVWEVLESCATKPYGFMPFQPGPGLGGHCIPVDPFYLAWKAREKHVSTEFIELAGRINAAMPAHVVTRVITALNARRQALNGARIALLGVAYKRDSADVRESPAHRIVELLREQQANVSYHDPHVSAFEVNGTAMRSQPLTREYLTAQDCVVVVTDHRGIDWTLVGEYARLVVDTRNVLRRASAKRDRLDEPEAAIAVRIGELETA